MYDSFCAQLPSFITNYYIKQKQSEAYQQNLKEAKETDSVGVLQVDFSEKVFHFLAGWSTECPIEQKANHNFFFMFLAQRFMRICSCNIWWFTPLKGFNNCFHQ